MKGHLMLKALFVAAALLSLAPSAFAQVEFWKHEWPDTDFSKKSVAFIEILSGGPPKDGIPALDTPKMIDVSADDSIGAREPVMTVEIAGQIARAYPIRYLMWHEIANDVIGDVPIAVTFCPLCNSAVTFDRRLDGRVLEFGVSGKLRHSDMVMYDRQTESWWQQFVGEAIVGELTGAKLTKLPSWMESWAEFRARNPDGLVMAEPAGHARRYGFNPYRGYDTEPAPFLYRGDLPPYDIHPLARVVVVGEVAWPLLRLSKAREIEEEGLRLTWAAGQASALDDPVIAEGREVGTVRVFDAGTGAPVVHDVAFAFAFHAFHPEGRWMFD